MFKRWIEKLRSMIAEDREFVDIFSQVDDILADDSETDRQKYIRQIARKSNAGKEV